MAYITKSYLSTQFTNFATRISTVFAKKTELPTNTSDLTNDSGFITNTVNNLTNYYNTSNTYSKTEIDSLISSAKSGRFIVVDTLPTTNISTEAIYLVPSSISQTSNVKDEYINLDGTTSGWELIGSTAVDLSGYLKTTDAESIYVKIADTESSNIDFSTYFG